MGFLSTIGSWIGSAARAVGQVVSGVRDFLSRPSVREGYEQVQRDMQVYRPAPRHTPLGLDRELMASAVRQTQQRADAALQQIQQLRHEQTEANRRSALHSQWMNLVLQSSAFDRYISNIEIHAANLEIHLHTIRNVTGLVEDVNALRFGLKRTMGTVNHLINLIHNAGLGHADKLAGIDVERDEGAISIRAAYGAFEKTRGLLSAEVRSLVVLAEQHLHEVRRVQGDAATHGDYGRLLSDSLEHHVVPQLIAVQRVGRQVGADVGQNFPALPPEEPIDRHPEPGHGRGWADARPPRARPAMTPHRSERA